MVRIDRLTPPDKANPATLGDRRTWVMVPVEPTVAMLRAGVGEIDWERPSPTTVLADMTVIPSGDHERVTTEEGATNLDARHLLFGEPYGTSIGDDMRDAWRAMLVAMPTPPGLLEQLLEARRKVVKIEADTREFDGDRRGHWADHKDAEEWFNSCARALADRLLGRSDPAFPVPANEREAAE